MNVFADKIHADAGADRCDIVGPQDGNDPGQGFEHIFLCNDDLLMFRSDVFRHFTGIFQINGVRIHTNGKSADRLFQNPRGNGAYQGRVQSSAQEKAYRSV